MHALRSIPVLLVLGGGGAFVSAQEAETPRTFREDVAFLKKHVQVLLLGEEGGPQVCLVPAWQGRVMTSAFGNEGDAGIGWINHALIASGEEQAHIHAFGGEDRFWLGPEGGQFALYFAPGTSFTFDDWQTPALIDTEPYPVVMSTVDQAMFLKDGELVNHSGTKFTFTIARRIYLLSDQQVEERLGASVPDGLERVAYASENEVRNRGEVTWTKDAGLMSIWILGMFKPSPRATVVVPFEPGTEAARGKIVNDAYFGKVPADRLKIGEDVLFFRGDGQRRGKIGLGPRRAKSRLGAWDADAGRLTIVHFDQPGPEVTDYVNSMWEHQEQPFAGDVVNSYNDGPTTPGGKPLGPFFELETSSPAAALKPGERLRHVHSTMHFRGERAKLDAIARAVFGVGLDAIEDAFAK